MSKTVRKTTRRVSFLAHSLFFAVFTFAAAFVPGFLLKDHSNVAPGFQKASADTISGDTPEGPDGNCEGNPPDSVDANCGPNW